MTRGIIRDGNNPQATKKHLRNHTEMARCSQGTLCHFYEMAQRSLGAVCHPSDKPKRAANYAAPLVHC